MRGKRGRGGHKAQGWSEAGPLQDKAQRGSVRGRDLEPEAQA